jgi:hypothetical protein
MQDFAITYCPATTNVGMREEKAKNAAPPMGSRIG